MTRITDPDVRILATWSASLESDYAADQLAWEGSPFAWIKTRPSRQVGVIGEKLLSGWLATKGFDVARSPDSEADRLVNGVRAEIKFSTLWAGGFYKFQQLRNQNYEFAICLGLSPFDANCWVIPKHVIIENRGTVEGLDFQHGGRAGRDTAWLTVRPGSEPAWLRRHGGRLAQAAGLIADLTGQNPLP